MKQSFYRAFEDRFRGPRELIRARLEAYLPFTEPLAKRFVGDSAIDLGCGRGEWLELLQSSGLKARGVDLDEGMLQACRERGLSAELFGALEYLKALEDESQVIVSAFHVVEHITFEELQLLVKESLRVLRPGGLMILETPNPENIAVATRNFYLDPTHVRPIPLELLSFLAEYVGFARVKVLRLQERGGLVDKEKVSLQDVFAGVSPDYSVVAQKKSGPEEVQLLSHAFSRDYGVGLDAVLRRWDQRFDGLEANLEVSMRLAEQAMNELRSVYASKSWRLTAPLRKLFGLFKK